MIKPKRMPLSSLNELKSHPFADLFPMADDEDLDGIAHNMAINGFRPDLTKFPNQHKLAGHVKNRHARIGTLPASQRPDRAAIVRFFCVWPMAERLWGGQSGRASGPVLVAERRSLGSSNLFVPPRLSEIGTSYGDNSQEVAMNHRGNGPARPETRAKPHDIEDFLLQLRALVEAAAMLNNGAEETRLRLQILEHLQWLVDGGWSRFVDPALTEKGGE